MDIRLVLPVLLLAAAVSLAGGVNGALTPPDSAFYLEPGGPVAGAWTALTMSGQFGSSPELVWGCPEGERLRGFALVGEDLDAGAESRVFWAVWDVPATARSLPPGLEPEALAQGMRQARLADGQVGYRSPGLEAATSHRLRLTLYALDDPLRLPAGSPAEEVLSAARERSIATTSWAFGGGW